MMAAQYRLLERSYLQPDGHSGPVALEAGAEFFYSRGAPGIDWRPINAEASAAKLAAFEAGHYAVSNDSLLLRLARSLGAPEGNSSWAAARVHVDEWIIQNREKT